MAKKVEGRRAGRKRGREKRDGEKETRDHGVDRALNPGPTGVLRRSTELVWIRVGPVSLLLVYRTMNPTSFLESFPFRPPFRVLHRQKPFLSAVRFSLRQ